MPRIRRSLIAEGKANTHLTHLEELVLTQGFEGYLLARSFLMELLETLKGNTKSKVSTSVKWDGAPAIFAGINPDNGKFFVGTKSVQNVKDPLINYTPQDIQDNHGKVPGLVDKLNRALVELPKLGIKNILQGDFMFDDDMLDVTEIDGEPHYRFKPNTIIYTVPVDSKLGREIGRSRFGIVFHTTYGGVDEKGRPTDVSYGADVSSLNRPPGIWFDDAFFDDDTGTVTLTTDEEVVVRSLIKQADAVNSKITYSDLPSAFLNIYINSEIRKGQFLENPEESYEGFLSWYQTAVIDKSIEKVKRKETKEAKRDAGIAHLKQFESKKEDILNLFKVSRLLFDAKNIFINKYNNAVYNTRHFLDDGSGDLVATNPEGYVAVDAGGNGVKFVDRLEFSRANFLMDKGFKKDVNESQILEVFWGNNGFSTKKPLQEWAVNLPMTAKTNRDLYMKLCAGVPITSLICDMASVKQALAEAVTWALNEQAAEDSNLIAIYPGRFQPMGRHHFQAYQKLVDRFGLNNTFIATSDITNSSSPLNFDEKKLIMMKYGIPESQIILTRNPYQAAEITSRFVPTETSVVFAVGKKDMETSPRFANLDGLTKKGVPAYYKKFNPFQELHTLDKHGYIDIAPHVSLDTPSGREMSGTSLRQSLQGASPEQFETMMGWFDQEAYELLRNKLKESSAMAMGAIGGASGTSGGFSGVVRRAGNSEEKEEELVTEVVNYLLGIMVG